jgi:uncharacterized membrane protein
MPDRRRRIAPPAAARPGAARTFLIVAAATLAAEVAAGAALTAVGGAAVLAALGNLFVSLRFAATLLPGREPLITRYSRFDREHLLRRAAPASPDAAVSASLPPEDGHGVYTRRLTAVWAALLGGFALAYAAAALASWPVAVLSAAEPLACATLFLGEHALRNRVFPGDGRATPLRTLRAIRLSHGLGGRGTVPHAA